MIRKCELPCAEANLKDRGDCTAIIAWHASLVVRHKQARLRAAELLSPGTYRRVAGDIFCCQFMFVVKL